MTLLAQIEPAARGSALASWTPLWVMLGVLAVALVWLVATGDRRRFLLGVPHRLEAITGVPAWAITTFAVSSYGLVVAGFGFYTDVAWHVALGRDEVLFTAPHTAIFVGLWLIALGPALGAATYLESARASGEAVRLRDVPRSLVALGVLGVAAITGFPVDEVWHQTYGVDVTMWSPPHLIMILAASLSGLGSWLVLADADVDPAAGRWPRALHAIAALLTLQGLSSVQGEFSFGIPQWQHLYHPVLVCLAAGVGLVLIRVALGRWWALGVAVVGFTLQQAGVFGDGGPVETRQGATYLVSAAVVEVLAWRLGTRRPLRLAVWSGVGIATLGLAGEWFWNQGAHQPWRAALLPEAVVVGMLAAVSGALLGATLAQAFRGSPVDVRMPRPVVALAMAAVVASLVIPGPRRGADVVADVDIRWVDDERAIVDAVLDPPAAADGARWFTVGSWQWGGRTIRHMEELSPGRWSSVEPIRLAGAKSLLRLHRGAEMGAIPLSLPADPEYGLEAVEPRDRTARFLSEQRYLQRESERPAGPLALAVYGLVGGLATAWLAAVAATVSSIGRRRLGARRSVPAPAA